MRADAEPGRPSGHSGFTLLEVLAAVAILGGLYVVLAGVAMQGLRAEGESRRRLEASLLADHHMSELEIQLEAGTVPELGTTESEEDDFQIAVEVKPFEAPIPLGEDAAEGDEEGDAAAASALEALRTIEVKISWLEGDQERSVLRTTYGFDRQAVTEIFGAAGTEEPEGGR